jgi:hypothetical protein
LAEKLPALAEAAAEFLDFIVDHPALAAGLGIAGRVAAPMVSGFAGNLLFGMGGPGGGMGGGLLGAGLRKLGPHAASAATALGTYAGNLTKWSTGPMAMHTNALKAAAGMGAAAAAGYALGTVIREEIIEPMLKEAELKRRQAHEVSKEAGAAGDLSVEQRKAAIEEIKRKKAALEETGVERAARAVGPEAFERGLATLFGDDPDETRRQQIELLTRQEERHQRELEKALTAQETANNGLEKFGDAAAKWAKQLEESGAKVSGSTTRGPKTKAKPKPGAMTAD